jgi:hypothetical protein
VYLKVKAMYTTYHLDSAQEITIDLLDSIKATFKTKAISITVVEEEKSNFKLSDEQKAIRRTNGRR